MVVRQFNVESIAVFPTKTDSVLIVDSTAVLSNPVPLQEFKSIPRGNSQIVQIVCTVQNPQFPQRNPRNGSPPPRCAAVKQLLGFAIAEGANHFPILLCVLRSAQ
jgi:hypothetical protein